MDKESSRWLTENVPQELIESTLFRFFVPGPGNSQISIDMTSGLDIDYERLEHTLEIVPAQYIYWAAVYSELRSQVSICEAKIARRKAMLIKALRKNAQTTGVRITDKQLELLIDGDDIDEAAVSREVSARSIDDGLNEQELQQRIKDEISKERQKTLPYLEMQLVIANKNAGKVYHMVQAIQMRSDNCRSLAGFKRQEHTQSGNLT